MRLFCPYSIHRCDARRQRVYYYWGRDFRMTACDLLLKNASVITMDPQRPSASLVAVQGEKIAFVGKSDDLEGVAGPGTRTIDCESKTVVPGFNDAHCHVFSHLRKLLSIDLSYPSVKSIADIKAVISEKARQTPPGRWIIANGYHEFYLAEKRHPTRWELDEVAPDHPVVLSHLGLHACVLNSRALALAGISRETPEPPGALFERDMETGEPNGILYEMLGYIREKVMPPISSGEIDKGIALANCQYLSWGITSLQEATVVNSMAQWRRFTRFKEENRLQSRVCFMPGIEEMGNFLKAGLTFGHGDHYLRVGGLKVILQEATGRMHPPPEVLDLMLLGAERAGFQVAMHAVQVDMVAAAISALERLREKLPDSGRRHRLEHCAECPPPLVERLRRTGAMVVTQPPFIYYNGERYLGMVPAEKQPWLYRFRTLLDAGIVVAASSDSPIVPANPLDGIHAAVNRRAFSGQELSLAERISPFDALRMYTVNAAFASHEEHVKGSIRAGLLADLVVLSADPTRVPPEEIRNIRVEMTIIGGKIVWPAGY